MTATLLASLFTVIAASSALAAPVASVTSAGSVPREGTSAGTASFSFTEDGVADWDNGTLTVTIEDNDSNPTVHFVGPGTLTAPDSLGASLSVGDNSFTVTITDGDDLNQELFSVSGLKIKADEDAALGGIETTYVGTGDFVAYFDAATATATGTLVTPVAIGGTAATIQVTSVCPFDSPTGGAIGNLEFATSAEAVAMATDGAVSGAGQQNVTFAATVNGHLGGEAVSQDIALCAGGAGVLAAAGTVVDSLDLDVEYGPFGVQPGLFNQEIGGFILSERSDPFLTVGTVISATITTAGVVWSNSIEANTHDSALALANETSTLSADRKTVTWTVGTASAAGDFGYVHSNGTWNVDVAADAVLGTAIDVTVTAGSLLIVPTSVTLGYINNVIAGTAATPIVYIGENDQQTGMVTIKESAIGSFTSGGSNNVFSVTLEDGEFFTRAPYAVVTLSNLKLRDPGTLLGVASLKGVLSNGSATATWTIYSASTDVPASIDIRGSDAAGAVLAAGSLNGARINVPAGLPIGTVNLNIASGTATNQTDFAILPIATRAFRNSVVVTALSQPVIPAGSADSLAGNISITETLTGQFRTDQTICVAILPRASNNAIQDTFLKTANTNDRPVVIATPGSGLVVGPVSIGCSEDNNIATNTTNSFQFDILQQAFAPNLGVITVSNLHYITVADAPAGNVLVSVFGSTDGTATEFQSIVSNAKIGAQVAGTAATRLGVTQVGAFTTATKVQKVGKYVTYRFDFGVAAAGQAIKVWGATKTGNDWTAFTAVTTRTANASGVVYYYIRQSAATWKSFRAQWTGGGVYTPARQSRWIP
jgi:hypothetical protein